MGMDASGRTVRQCREEGEVPCEVMWLIVAWGDRRGVIGDLNSKIQHRSWEGAKPGSRSPTLRGDYCIKRPQWLVDNPQNDCRQNPGCTDC